MKIYALSKGEYSYYRIIALFSSEEKAEAARKVINDAANNSWDNCNDGLEIFELDSIINEDGLARFYYWIYEDTGDFHIEIEFEDDKSRELNKVYPFKVTPYEREQTIRYEVTVKAENKEHAIKIASDLIAQYKANNHD